MFTINENCLKQNQQNESNESIETNFYYYKGLDKLEKNMYENIDDENTSIYDEMLNREDE